MAAKSPAFAYRMLFAPSRELIDYACKLGMNWVVVATSGHKTVYRPHEDPPVYMPSYKKLHAIRRRMRRDIEAEREQVRQTIAYAKKRGLKVIYNTYEISVPAGFEKAYPGMFSPPIREFLSRTTPEQRQLNLCVSRPEVREALAAKVQELCETFPDIDGFAYTNNESATKTQCWHRCERCRDIPFGRMMKYLHDAMAEGVERSGRRVRLFARCWGSHETDFRYWGAFAKRVEWGAHEFGDKEWLPAYVESFRPARLHFRPSRDIPQFLRLLKRDETAFIYKASWADNNLHHPLNPWIGKYTGHDEICEVSFEHAFYRPRVFYVMGREMQRRARLCRARGAAGLCTVPISWGAHDGEADRLHPSRCMLAELNLHVMAALSRNADADIDKVARSYLRRRYGRRIAGEAELAGMLLDSEDVAAEAMNIRGVRTTSNGEQIPADFHGFITSLLRYGPMYTDWQKRLAPTPANLRRIFKAKDSSVARAEGMLARIGELKGSLPSRAYREFSECFGYLLTMARSFQAAHKLFLSLWAIRQGHAAPTTAKLNELLEMMKRYGEVLPLNKSR